jgi:hypothetical protein
MCPTNLSRFPWQPSLGETPLSFDLASQWYKRINHKSYRALLLEPLKVFVGLPGQYRFYSNSICRGELKDGWLEIFPGYASDGATPFYRIGTKISFGVPTTRAMWPAVFVHDFLMQFLGVKGCPWNWGFAHKVFYILLMRFGVPSFLVSLYYWFVKGLPGKILRLLPSRKKDLCIEILDCLPRCEVHATEIWQSACR